MKCWLSHSVELISHQAALLRRISSVDSPLWGTCYSAALPRLKKDKKLVTRWDSNTTPCAFVRNANFCWHCFAGGAQAGVREAAEAGAQDGGGRAEEAARPRTRLPVHRLRPQRPLQLRRHAAAGKEPGRAPASATSRGLLPVDDTAPRVPGQLECSFCCST